MQRLTLTGGFVLLALTALPLGCGPPDTPPPPRGAIVVANRIDISCGIGYRKYQPKPSEQRLRALRRDIPTLVRAFKRDPDGKYRVADGSETTTFTLRKVMTDTLRTMNNDGACEPLAPPLRSALRQEP